MRAECTCCWLPSPELTVKQWHGQVSVGLSLTAASSSHPTEPPSNQMYSSGGGGAETAAAEDDEDRVHAVVEVSQLCTSLLLRLPVCVQ
jgi:hypothetical protein